MQVVTQDKLVNILNGKKGAFFATIFSRTKPDMNKTNNPYYDKVLKESEVNVCLNWIYENAVNNQREREGKEPDFEAEPRSWGVRIPKHPFVIHKGKLYLEAKIQKSLGHKYKLNGKEISEEIIQRYLRKKTEGSRQKLETPVKLRDYSIDNIISIIMDGEQYVVEKKVGL